jgi:hypothetical protein
MCLVGSNRIVEHYTAAVTGLDHFSFSYSFHSNRFQVFPRALGDVQSRNFFPFFPFLIKKKASSLREDYD